MSDLGQLGAGPCLGAEGGKRTRPFLIGGYISSQTPSWAGQLPLTPFSGWEREARAQERVTLLLRGRAGPGPWCPGPRPVLRPQMAPLPPDLAQPSLGAWSLGRSRAGVGSPRLRQEAPTTPPQRCRPSSLRPPGGADPLRCGIRASLVGCRPHSELGLQPAMCLAAPLPHNTPHKGLGGAAFRASFSHSLRGCVLRDRGAGAPAGRERGLCEVR